MLVSRLPRAKLHNLSSITSDRCISRYFLTHIPNFHSFRDVYSSNVRIGKLSRAGKMDLARKLFDEMPTRDVVSWNAVITGYWKNGFIEESKRMFDLMPLRNVVSWNSMIAGCVENGMIDIAFAYFSEMPERNTASWNAMISGFIRYKRVDEAVELFEQMPKRNVISYTAMIDGYAQKGDVKKARELFDSMTTRNEVSWTVMISAYVENEQFDEAREIFGRMPCKNVVAITAMITGYCKEGKMEDARVLFEEIECKDDVSFNAMITGYAHNGRGNALITMYSKCGCLPDSESAFEHIKTPNIVSWNTIIAAFAQHGAYEKALELFKKIELHGIEPDGITFLSLLSACGHAGKVKESLYWFKSMKSFYNVAPRSEHYACLIDILGRSGEVKKAYEIIQEMPFEPDAGVWGAILAGCSFSMNNNTELAELAFEKLTGFDPKNSGAYVMLSNIYASLGLWREVTRVRGLMKGNEVKKQTGFSWMEIGDTWHYFVGGDVSHFAINEIRMLVNQIYSQMKLVEDAGF
ncbi:unnamed protein product [Lactuca saligna]|uniref:Pentacotripeptide-repeat region of PRORP domain-containing protein n=1 Tax=Lactuca saligna TaxID=75948 RepID=A0AA35Z2Q5_LACSI|nr:unnamed protein product [Lactuca saligna]